MVHRLDSIALAQATSSFETSSRRASISVVAAYPKSWNQNKPSHFAGADRGRDDDSGRPSLRTGQANFWHPALQLVVTSKKIGKPPHAPVLRRTSQLW